MNFRHFGVMIDCSRDAVMKVEQLKTFINYIQKMGYNTLGLYMEDTYEVIGEPNFGYLRGRYTIEELKSLDEYAKNKGIELIPCVQTLAHFTALDKGKYRDIIDCEDILLIDEPKTYEFIDKLFQSLSNAFSTRNINIGMDEAFMVGRGKYLDKHGYSNRIEMLVKHLEKVAFIAKKYGFQTQMWSDMFFRLVNGGEYYAKDAPISEQVNKMIPSNVELCYWDYYHTDKKVYDEMISKHLKFNCGLWFAGGAWTWNGFAPLGGFTLKTMEPAMKSVVEYNIENVLITMWGDNGAECSIFSQLHTLYAIRQFANGNFDLEEIKKGFYTLFGFKFSDFMLLDLPNMMYVEEEQMTSKAFCKPLLYIDPFMGIFDKNLENNPHIPFEKYAVLLKNAKKRVHEFSYLFDELSSLCYVLAIKAELGIKTRKAYLKNDKETLIKLVGDFNKVYKRVRVFHQKFFELWQKENKPQGWEIHDARLGGLLQRLQTCKKRLQSYIVGELEEEILLIGDGINLSYNNYIHLISTNIL